MILDESNEIENLDESGVEDFDSLLEACLYDAIKAMPDEDRKAYMESSELKTLCESNVIGKKTFVRLSKIDDLSRRIKLAVYAKAKEDNDPNYIKLRKIQAKKHDLNNKLMQKYGMRVKQDAVKAQRSLIKINPTAFTRPLR